MIKVEPIEFPLISNILSDSSTTTGKNDTPRKIRKPRVVRNPAQKKKKKMCIECNKSFTDIIAHRVKFHELEHLFECENCEFKTYDLKEFKFHKKMNHKPKKYKDDAAICPYCALSVKSSLDDHIANIHKKEKNFFCDLCSFAAYRKTSIEYHILHNHCTVKSFNCSLCNFSTVTKQRLKVHIGNIHEIAHETFPCKYAECEKTFTKKCNLDYHVKRCHEGEHRFPCEHPGCDKVFYTRQERKTHFGNQHGKLFYLPFLNF